MSRQHSILAVEVAVRTGLGSPLRAQLHQLLSTAPERTSSHLKWQMYSSACATLAQYMAWVDYACWDFFDDDERARNDFDMWVGGMTSREGARATPSLDPNYPSQDLRYLTFTMAILVVQGSPAELAIKQRLNVSEDRLWNKDTIYQVLQAIPQVDFNHVVADVAYLIPGHDTYSLTPEDLREPKFEYLRPLQG